MEHKDTKTRRQDLYFSDAQKTSPLCLCVEREEGRQRFLFTLLLFFAAITLPLQTLKAQITGVVIDANDGGPVPYTSVVYKGNNVGTKADGNGAFTIGRHNGWRLTFSSVGYVTQVVNVNASTPSPLTIRLQPESHKLQEVTVKSKKKTRYSRKDNPAVELMRKVIAAKKKSDIKQHDFYRYNNYQKIMFGLNDLNPAQFDKGLFKSFPWLIDQVETCQYNDKLILPLTVDETFTEHRYRKSPAKEKTVILGQKSSGVNDLFQTGEILTAVMRETFNDVDIYDDNILLMRHKFCSPIGRNAIAFYRFYITDTLYVGHDRCVMLDFMPNNQQDFGFRGRIYIVNDSSYQVKRCELYLPKSSDVNWIDGFQCMQEFTKMPDGQWLLTIDDMIAELMVTDFITKAIVTRTTRLSDFDFSPIPKNLMRGGEQELAHGANDRDDAFWAARRQVEFTKSEAQMGGFLDKIESVKGYKYGIFVLRALVENYLETGTREKPSKFDVGPINTVISQNFYDGLRFRLSGQTTANLNPHLFWKGYVAHGTRHNENYYNTELTYSLNSKDYLPQEFPQRNITFSSKRDVAMPSDKYVTTDKDNVFTSFKVHEIDKMLMYNAQQLGFTYETDAHLRMSASLKTEKIEPIGNLSFTPLSLPIATVPSVATVPSGSPLGSATVPSSFAAGPLPPTHIRYTEASFGLRIAPKEKFINTKQRRRVISRDAWFASVQHTVGIKGFIGGQYNYNFTEADIYKRFWLPMSWGRIDMRLRGGVQWNQVPYPLLIMPQANLSYIFDINSFNTINNMEFLNDRYASLMLNWELGGKIFNRIPLLKKLKWREVLELKCLTGTLTAKNNPFLQSNANSDILMHFPAGSYVMDGKTPYVEYALGVQNIFNLIQVMYVHRVNYMDMPGAARHGIRVVFNPTF